MVFLFLLYLPQFGYKQAIKGNSLFSDLLPRKNFENVVNAPSSECAASPKLSSYRGHNNKYFKHVSLRSDLKQIHMYEHTFFLRIERSVNVLFIDLHLFT